MEQSFLFTVFWKDEMYIGDISEMMDNLGCITDGNNIVPITAAMGYAVQNDNLSLIHISEPTRRS